MGFLAGPACGNVTLWFSRLSAYEPGFRWLNPGKCHRGTNIILLKKPIDYLYSLVHIIIYFEYDD